MARPEADAQEAGAALRRAAWDPVAALLGDATRVYVVPDGALLGVPFAALPDDRGGYLLESGPTFHFLSAERDLVGDDEPAPSRAFGLLALGGPVFDAAPWAEPTPSRVQQLIAAARAALPLALLRGSTSACSGFTGMAFDPLPDAALEARDVAKTWRAQADRAQQSRRVTELLGGQATESAFKRLASDHRYLHLATHGFFVGGACASDTTLENPLVRSGLALSGFNRRAEAPRNADDGVLTAEEVASLDLSGVEWAVLSACDTGLGDVAAGEGVIGLQRAFRIAGARTLIMSLWSVPDVETREWMKALYEARLGRGLDTPTSVRHASLAVLQHRRERGLSDQPFTWGAFVASGDPR
jgi:CHAT domain-containing protein